MLKRIRALGASHPVPRRFRVGREQDQGSARCPSQSHPLRRRNPRGKGSRKYDRGSQRTAPGCRRHSQGRVLLEVRCPPDVCWSDSSAVLQPHRDCVRARVGDRHRQGRHCRTGARGPRRDSSILKDGGVRERCGHDEGHLRGLRHCSKLQGTWCVRPRLRGSRVECVGFG